MRSFKIEVFEIDFNFYILILEFLLFTNQKSYLKAETTDLKHTCDQAISRCMNARTLQSDRNLVSKSSHSEALCLLGTGDTLILPTLSKVCVYFLCLFQINQNLWQCKLQLSRLLCAPTRQQQFEKRKYRTAMGFGGIWKAIGRLFGLFVGSFCYCRYLGGYLSCSLPGRWHAVSRGISDVISDVLFIFLEVFYLKLLQKMYTHYRLSRKQNWPFF